MHMYSWKRIAILLVIAVVILILSSIYFGDDDAEKVGTIILPDLLSLYSHRP